MKRILISDIAVKVSKKKMKNIRLRIELDTGQVCISAPTYVSDKTIIAFAEEHMDWIKEHRERYRMNFSWESPYVSGEALLIWGKEHRLIVMESNRKNSFEIDGDALIISLRGNSSPERQMRYIRSAYGDILKSELSRLIPKWESRTGLYCDSWDTRFMRRRWGSCSVQKKRLLFNTKLAQMPVECLEYVILHELAHLRIKNHGKDFRDILDCHMQDWREIRKKLNSHIDGAVS